MKGAKVKKYILVTILLFLIILTVTALIRPSVKTVEAVSETYEDKIEFKGFYFAPEYVVYKGKIDESQLKCKDGDKIPRGIPIYQNIVSNEAGILSAHLDGYENNFNIDNVFSNDEGDIDKIIKHDSLEDGIRIINNSEWFIYAYVDKNNVFKAGSSYNLLIDGSYYPASITKVNNTKGGNYLIFRIRDDLNVLNLHRGIKGYIIKSRYDGIVVPSSSIVTKNGKNGVLIKTNGYVEFRRVKIVFSGNDISVISTDVLGRKINDYDKIICNPHGLREGMKVN